MFVADGLVYLELQKTGGSHICRLMERYLHARPEGKHNRVTADIASAHVIGSIRNPWDWYVSLWAYGVGGRGAVRTRTVTGVDFNYYHRLLPLAMGKHWLTPGELASCLWHDAVKPVRRWRSTYHDSSDPALFRAWLKMLLDKKRRFDIGEGYGFSPLSEHAGLLTYRYFRLYTIGDSVYRDRRLAKAGAIADFDREFNITRGMIRTESLEDDFVRVLSEAGRQLDAGQIEAIRSRQTGKTNASERRPAGFYYDDDTIGLVARRERYLIEKYGYHAPDTVRPAERRISL
jgi:hypothetical protein